MEGKGKREEGRKTEMKKWREVPGAVADPGEGSKGPKKKSFETGRPPPPPPPHLRAWMTPPPHPYLRSGSATGEKGKEREKKMDGRGGRKDVTKEERN